jgi:hypothetical protein
MIIEEYQQTTYNFIHYHCIKFNSMCTRTCLTKLMGIVSVHFDRLDHLLIKCSAVIDKFGEDI